ncbi:DUF5666 domain-containing protein [Nocardia terpenica]|uniref:DUF5666 domain-containing protein n=1 Tax=Nocardia terpenica TaxID=455432 RepID=A0A6G9ZC88_9NOCA|nr:DUF5666 domain-containing protein [Nocardia terpenica]QIS23239.1 hypothetical protein F6W96_37775 [Nocardia terpenica]
MTNPSDPWAQRPDSADAPTERVGEPYNYFEQPPGPNPTRELPPYESQYGVYEPADGYDQWRPGAAPMGGPAYGPGGPQGPVGPTGLPVEPPPPRRTGLWVALTAGIFALVVLGGVVAGLVLAGHNSSSSSSADGNGYRPVPSQVPVIPPQRPSNGPQPNLPPLPGLGDMDNLGATMGTITANDGSTLTIDSLLGSTVTVHTDDKTQIVTSGAGKVADLHVGDMVVVQGDKQQDNSILAKIIISTTLPPPR